MSKSLRGGPTGILTHGIIQFALASIGVGYNAIAFTNPFDALLDAAFIELSIDEQQLTYIEEMKTKETPLLILLSCITYNYF